MNRTPLLAGFAAAAAGACLAIVAMQGLGFGPRDVEEGTGGDAIRAYLLAHPEVIGEAMERMQDRQTGALIDARRAAIETPFAGAVAGNPQGDVALVEYSDYFCGYCRVSVGDVDRLVKADPGVRVVFKELPILAPESADAAKVALAAARAGRFDAVHHALYAAGPLDAGKIAAVAAAAGLPPSAGDAPAIATEIKANLDTARALHLSGTPSFVVGDQLLAGAVGYQALKDAVDRARTERKG